MIARLGACALAAMLGNAVSADDNWGGSIRAKVQTDNRYTHEANVFGEVWGQFQYQNTDWDLQGAIDVVDRLSALRNDSEQQVYQGYLQKGFADLGARLKLGRFQRTDNLGFYYLDGLDFRYAPKDTPWSLNVYGGRPGRMDHVLSVEGDYLFGVEGTGHFKPEWAEEWFPLSLDVLDVRAGYQRFKGPREVDRINVGMTAAGKIATGEGHKYEAMFSGTYRADSSALENVWFSGQADFTKQLRLRLGYEEYKPRNPFPTFRERFYTAYALGEQTLLKGSAHHSPFDGWTYYVGGQRATRDVGVTGYGGYAGLSVTHWPGLVLNGEVDYLELGQENAKSLYLSAAYSPSYQWRVAANLAVREEDKLLYGENRALGGELEVQYMIQNNLVLSVTGTYIGNTRIHDEYLGAVQVIYYFDNFKPKPL